MSATTAFWKWSLIGGFAAGLLVVAQANAVGGYAGLLQVGEDSALRPVIEDELGDIPVVPHGGHDGQISYAIALDLMGDEVPELLDHGAYRYRRILYPAVASLLGLLDGEALLAGMIVLSVLSAAAATGLTGAVAARFGRSDWFAVAVLFNPGVWLSVRLLTSDVVALALMLGGLYWLVVGRRGAVAAFALSVLAKDSYLTTPGGLAISRDHQRWRLLLVALATLTIWMTWLTFTIGEGFSSRGNLGMPFMGIIEASDVWGTFEPSELLYLIFALASVAVGLVYSLLVRSWLRWPILGWSLLGVISSNWVWDLGNNAARVFAPILILIVWAEARRTEKESGLVAKSAEVRTSE